MNDSISNGLKITFLLHALIAGLVGIQHLFFPRIWTDLAGMQIFETVTWRLLGAALIAFATSSWLSFRESEWSRVRIVVILEIVWSGLGAAVILWGILQEGLAPLEWVNVVLLLVFALIFLYFSMKKKTSH